MCMASIKLTAKSRKIYDGARKSMKQCDCLRVENRHIHSRWRQLRISGLPKALQSSAHAAEASIVQADVTVVLAHRCLLMQLQDAVS